MAKELLLDALWLRIAPFIPPEAPKPKGGWPRVGPGGGDRDPVRAEDRYSLGVLACLIWPSCRLAAPSSPWGSSANTLVAVLSSDSTCLDFSGSLVIGEDHTV